MRKQNFRTNYAVGNPFEGQHQDIITNTDLARGCSEVWTIHRTSAYTWETEESFNKILDAYGTPSEIFVRQKGANVRNQRIAENGECTVRTIIPEAKRMAHGAQFRVLSWWKEETDCRLLTPGNLSGRSQEARVDALSSLSYCIVEDVPGWSYHSGRIQQSLKNTVSIQTRIVMANEKRQRLFGKNSAQSPVMNQTRPRRKWYLPRDGTDNWAKKQLAKVLLDMFRERTAQRQESMKRFSQDEVDKMKADKQKQIDDKPLSKVKWAHLVYKYQTVGLDGRYCWNVKSFKSQQELFSYLVNEREEIFAQRKSMIKRAEGTYPSPCQPSMLSSPQTKQLNRPMKTIRRPEVEKNH